MKDLLLEAVRQQNFDQASKLQREMHIVRFQILQQKPLLREA